MIGRSMPTAVINDYVAVITTDVAGCDRSQQVNRRYPLTYYVGYSEVDPVTQSPVLGATISSLTPGIAAAPNGDVPQDLSCISTATSGMIDYQVAGYGNIGVMSLLSPANGNVPLGFLNASDPMGMGYLPLPATVNYGSWPTSPAIVVSSDGHVWVVGHESSVDALQPPTIYAAAGLGPFHAGTTISVTVGTVAEYLGAFVRLAPDSSCVADVPGSQAYPLNGTTSTAVFYVGRSVTRAVVCVSYGTCAAQRGGYTPTQESTCAYYPAPAPTTAESCLFYLSGCCFIPGEFACVAAGAAPSPSAPHNAIGYRYWRPTNLELSFLPPSRTVTPTKSSSPSHTGSTSQSLLLTKTPTNPSYTRTATPTRTRHTPTSTMTKSLTRLSTRSVTLTQGSESLSMTESWFNMTQTHLRTATVTLTVRVHHTNTSTRSRTVTA
jgi:hypothetical protein